MDVSIILLVYNGQKYLDEVLKAIFSQKTSYRFEIIGIDSGSSDQSLEILKRYDVKIYQIQNSEFSHGKTRNSGVQLSSGKYVVFLTQDATPSNDAWLQNIVSIVASSDKIAGAYSRQLARPDCNPCEWRDINLGAGPISMVKKINFENDFEKNTYLSELLKFIQFSNVSSCIRKEQLLETPFDEKIVMVEDQNWCKRALENGFEVWYEASSVVYHSHNHSLKEIYKRHYDYGQSLKAFVEIRMHVFDIVVYFFRESINDFFFILLLSKSVLWKARWSVRAPFVRFFMRLGLYRGLSRTS